MPATGFLPDPARGRACDAAMVAGLRDSLRYLADATAAEVPQVAALLAGLPDSPSLVAPLPEAFARYYRLTRALVDGRHDAALDEARALAAQPPRAEDRLLAAGTADAAPVAGLLAQDDDPMLRLAPPADPDGFATTLADARFLLSREIPALAGEIAAIVNTVLIGQEQPGSPVQFHGASHYQFWGLLILNPVHHPTPLALVEAMAHEAGHSLLFGLTVDEPLVLNPDAALFPSPLRADPRPMDGVFHATFVSARMAWAMERLAASPRLPAADRATAAKAAAEDRANFAAGDAVVRAHGDLTATGRAVIEAARAWIAQG